MSIDTSRHPSPRIGLLVPQYGATASEALDAAREADAVGLDVWVAGQLLPRPETTVEQTVLEPLTLMAAIAASTVRSRLGFMALAAPYWSPFYLARALVTLDEIAKGRLDVGIGAGWQRDEFDALGLEFADLATRSRHVESAVVAIEEQFALRGRTAKGELDIQSPRPPLWVVGSSTAMLSQAARHADWGNFARGIPVDDFRRIGAQLQDLCEGRQASVRLSLTATFLGGPDEDAIEARIARRAGSRGLTSSEYRALLLDSGTFVGTPRQIAEQMTAFTAVGAEAFVLWPLEGDRVDAARLLGDVARQIAGNSSGRPV